MAASAGGIQALSRVLGELPVDFPAPIEIVQHRTPDHRSRLASVLARASRLPVVDAREGEELEPGRVYVARADRHLTLAADKKLRYVDGRGIRFVLSSANPLLESVASTIGPHAIAVILTGGGMDATDGVQAIRASGGIVIAQNRETSQVFGMPRAAIATGAVDYVLPLSKIAPALVRLVTRDPKTPPPGVQRFQPTP
jgi:two-component system chemotaxis response regulator CheB